MTEPIDPNVRFSKSECVIVFELDKGAKESEFNFTEVKTPEGFVVKFTYGELFHDFPAIPENIWNALDTKQEPKLDGRSAKRTIKKGSLKTLDDLKKAWAVKVVNSGK